MVMQLSPIKWALKGVNNWIPPDVLDKAFANKRYYYAHTDCRIPVYLDNKGFAWVSYSDILPIKDKMQCSDVAWMQRDLNWESDDTTLSRILDVFRYHLN
jgi:hypothetical protein